MFQMARLCGPVLSSATSELLLLQTEHAQIALCCRTESEGSDRSVLQWLTEAVEFDFAAAADRLYKSVSPSSHDALQLCSGLTNHRDHPVWCHSGIKTPAGWPAALSRVSVPSLDASAGGTAVRKRNRTTRHRPVVLFYSEGFLRGSAGLIWIFWLVFWIKILDFLQTALFWAHQASLCRQVSEVCEVFLVWRQGADSPRVLVTFRWAAPAEGFLLKVRAGVPE